MSSSSWPIIPAASLSIIIALYYARQYDTYSELVVVVLSVASLGLMAKYVLAPTARPRTKQSQAVGAEKIPIVKGRYWLNLDILLDWAKSSDDEVGWIMVLLGRKYGTTYNTRVLAADQVRVRPPIPPTPSFVPTTIVVRSRRDSD
jgi:hypothetical protein